MAVSDESKGREPQTGCTVLSSWAFSRVGQTLILMMYGAKGASEEEFTCWLRRLDVRDFTHILIYSQGSSLTAKQRSRIADYWNNDPRPTPRVALMTNSLAERAILTAIGWLLRTQKEPPRAFGHADLDAAVYWLGDEVSPMVFADEIARLQAALRMNAPRLDSAQVAQRKRP